MSVISNKGKKRDLYELTPEHTAQLKPWADRWIANAMSCEAMDDADRAKEFEQMPIDLAIAAARIAILPLHLCVADWALGREVAIVLVIEVWG